MKSKSNSFAIFVLLVLALSFTSALDLDKSSLDTFTEEGEVNSFTISADSDFNITSFNNSITIENGEEEAQFSITTSDSLENTNKTIFDVNLTSLDSGFALGDFSETIYMQIVNSTNSSDNQTMRIDAKLTKSFYDGDNNGDLSFLDIDEEVKRGFGEEGKWYLFDEIEVELEIKNKGDWDIEDIEIEACLYNIEDNKCVLDEDDMNLDESFDLDAGDEKTITSTFVLDADDFEEDEEDYELYVKAVGEIDDRDSDYDGDETGTSDSEPVDIEFDGDFVILQNLEVPETTSCDNEIQILGKLWNIGDNNQDDIKLVIRNSELGIHETKEFDELDKLEDDSFDIKIQIPKDAEEKTYGLRFEVYDEYGDLFENDEDDESVYTAIFDIEGNCILPSEVNIDASLESEAIAGELLDVKIILTNIGTETSNYTISLENYDSWAMLESIDTESLTLEQGETKEANLVLIPNSEIEGEQEFLVKVLHNNNTNEQKININISPKKGIFGFIDDLSIKDNWLLWVLGTTNIILIILIIIVIVKIARK